MQREAHNLREPTDYNKLVSSYSGAPFSNGRWRPTVQGVKKVQAQANPALPRSKTEQKELSIPGWLSHLLG